MSTELDRLLVLRSRTRAAEALDDAAESVRDGDTRTARDLIAEALYELESADKREGRKPA